MGLFDFLKKKEQQKTAEETKANTSEPYLGDLGKTNILFHLVQTPAAERDEKWQQLFLENVAQASFRCSDPQVITGPDGFPYFQLFLPEPHKSFNCYVIDRMKDDFLLERGLGIVINPTANNADWVLSNGDIVNYHLNKEFYSDKEAFFSDKSGSFVVSADEEVMIGQPSESFFPENSKKLIRTYLEENGIIDTKILLMIRRNDMSQHLVFNLIPAYFDSEESYNAVMRTISWYLPKHYSLIGAAEETMADGFARL
jgi:hypothetical protein